MSIKDSKKETLKNIEELIERAENAKDSFKEKDYNDAQYELGLMQDLLADSLDSLIYIIDD